MTGCVNFWYSLSENRNPSGVRATQRRPVSGLGCL